MAKKNENKLSYLQLPLPEGRKSYKMTKRSFGDYNRRQVIDTGMLSMEKNISTAEAPYLTPSPKPKAYINKYDGYNVPISLFGFGDFLLVIYKNSSNQIAIDYIAENITENETESITENVTENVTDDVTESIAENVTEDITESSTEDITYSATESITYNLTEDITEDLTEDITEDITPYTGVLSDSADDLSPRSIVQFNHYDTVTDSTGSGYTKKLLIFPDKKSIDFEITGDFTPDDITGMPDIKYATVHLSRLFGVDDTRVYASGFNNYANWNLDTADSDEGYDENNAWCSAAQSNTKAGGEFTGITTFLNHVVCFKRDFMHEIYNTKNPFRIQDIYAEGAIDNRTIQDVDGRLIFVSEDDVKVYTGSNPRVIGYNLGIDKYVYAVSGTDNRNYYLYCEDTKDVGRLFVYDTFTDQWSEREISSRVISFAHNSNGMYALCKNGCIYKLDTEDYSHAWCFETDLITNETVNIKHIKKLQIFADIAEDANIKVYMLYDDEVFDEEKSHLVYSSDGDGRKAIRVKPRKTANYGIKLHVEGEGFVKLYELEIFMETGGELYV